MQKNSKFGLFHLHPPLQFDYEKCLVRISLIGGRCSMLPIEEWLVMTMMASWEDWFCSSGRMTKKSAESIMEFELPPCFKKKCNRLDIFPREVSSLIGVESVSK